MKKSTLNHWIGKYSYLYSIKINRCINEEIGLECEVIFELSDDNSKNSLLKFFGVRDFKLGNIHWPSVVLVSVVDISADQMEDIKYRVKEDENELFSFYCKNFSFEEIT